MNRCVGFDCEAYRASKLIDEYFIGVWSLGFPVHYQLRGTRIKLTFRGIAREYTIVIRKGLENSTIVSLTYTGLDYYDLARINRSRIEYDYYNLPKYMGEVGGQLYAYEGLVWSERLYDAYHNSLRLLRDPPGQLASVIERIESNVTKIVKWCTIDVVAYVRPHLPEYAIAIKCDERRVIVAWYNEISGRIEGLIDEPLILVSVLRKVLGNERPSIEP